MAARLLALMIVGVLTLSGATLMGCEEQPAGPMEGPVGPMEDPADPGEQQPANQPADQPAGGGGTTTTP